MMTTRSRRHPRIRHVRARLKQGRQNLGTWDVTLDPSDPAATRTLLARLCEERGIDEPTAAHRVELYEGGSGKWIGEVTAG
jgi:hypothetical protein